MRAWILAGVPFLGVMLVQACSSGGGGGGTASCADGGVCPSGTVCNTQTFACDPVSGSGGSGGGQGGSAGGSVGGSSGVGGDAGSGFGGSGGGFGGSGGGFGGSGGGFGGSGGGTGGSGGSGTVCDDCLASNCPSQYQACQNSPECVQFAQCAANCTDQTCIQGCASSYPAGYEIYSGVVACAQTYCQTECF